MNRFRSRRNQGCGRSLAFAGSNVLRQIYGAGHFGTQESHRTRWKAVARWLSSRDIRDSKDITGPVIDEYIAALNERLHAGECSYRTAEASVSTLNVILPKLTRRTDLHRRPSEHLVGHKTVARTKPADAHHASVDAAATALRAERHLHAASVMELVSEFGLRRREACLLEVHSALRQAIRHRRIRITAGTKGGTGRSLYRSVPVTARGLEVLKTAARLAANQANLIPHAGDATGRLGRFKRHVTEKCGEALKRHGIAHLRDLRATYACRRFEQLTGVPAPVNLYRSPLPPPNIEPTAASGHLDIRGARLIIARELGHRRESVVDSYCGKPR